MAFHVFPSEDSGQTAQPEEAAASPPCGGLLSSFIPSSQSMISLTVMHLSGTSPLTRFPLFLLLSCLEKRDQCPWRTEPQAGRRAIVAPFPGSLTVPSLPTCTNGPQPLFLRETSKGKVCGSALLGWHNEPQARVCARVCTILKRPELFPQHFGSSLR